MLAIMWMVAISLPSFQRETQNMPCLSPNIEMTFTTEEAHVVVRSVDHDVAIFGADCACQNGLVTALFLLGEQ
jgi:hypothetical protein